MFWLSLYAVHLKEPGYLKKNTDEYQQMLKTVNRFQIDYERNLNSKKLFSRLRLELKTHRQVNGMKA